MARRPVQSNGPDPCGCCCIEADGVWLGTLRWRVGTGACPSPLPLISSSYMGLGLAHHLEHLYGANFQFLSFLVCRLCFCPTFYTAFTALGPVGSPGRRKCRPGVPPHFRTAPCTASGPEGDTGGRGRCPGGAAAAAG